MDSAYDELTARLRDQPDDAEAFRALADLLRTRGAAVELVDLLEAHAQRTPRDADAVAYFREAATLSVSPNGNIDRALGLLEAALERDPMDSEVVEHLIAVAPRDAVSTPRLLHALESRIRNLQRRNAAPDLLAVGYEELGEFWEQWCGRADKALANYRQAITLDARNVRALYGARQLLRADGDLHELSKLYELEATAETDQTRKVALLLELGQMRADELHDLNGAIDVLDRAHNLDPESIATTRALAGALLRKANTEPKDEAARLHDVAGSLYYDAALTLPPDEALSFAEECLAASPGHEQALNLLERLAPSSGRADLLPYRWVRYLEHTPDGPYANQRRRKLGKAYVDNKQPMDAIHCLEPLLDRGDPEAADMLVALFRTVGRDEDAVRALNVALAGLPSDKRVPRLREILHLRIDQNKHEEALAVAREILALSPADEIALDLLEEEYGRTEDWDALHEVLHRAARVPDLPVESRKQVLRDMAALCETSRNDKDGAIRAWQAFLAMDPSDTDARDSLMRLYEEASLWEDLVEFLDRCLASTTDPARKVAYLHRLAAVQQHKRGNVQEAIRALRSLREIRKDDTAARDALCDALLEVAADVEALPLLRARIADAAPGATRARLLETLAKVLDERLSDPYGAFDAYAALLDERPADLSVIDAMVRVDTEVSNWERLVSTLAYRAELEPEEARAAAYVRMAEITDRELGDVDRAADFYGQALVLDPGNDSILDALAHTYGRTARYRDLVAVLAEKAKRQTAPATRAKLNRRIARILGEQLHNETAAHEAWLRVLADEEDEEGLRFVLGMTRRVGDATGTEDVLRRLALIVETDLERVDLMLQRAELLTRKLDRPKDALTVLRDVVDRVDGTHLGALDWLAAFYENAGEYTELAEMLERQLAVANDDVLRAPIARRLSDVRLRILKDVDGGLRSLAAWRAAAPSDMEPLRRTAQVLAAEERFAELRDIYDALEAVDSGPGGRKWRLLAAEVSAGHLDDPDGAFARIATLAEQGDGEALAIMARIEGRHSVAPDAAHVKLRRADAEDDPRRKKIWLLEAARLFETVMVDHARALAITQRALDLDPSDLELLRALERRAEMARDPAAVAHARNAVASHLSDAVHFADSPLAKVIALLASARFAWSVLQVRDEFAARLREAVEVAGDNMELLSRIEREVGALDGSGPHTVIDLLVTEFGHAAERHADDPHATAELLFRAGRLLASGLGSPREAFEVLRRATTLDPANPAILDEMASISARLGNLHELDEHLDQLVSAAMDGVVAARILQRRARLLALQKRYSDAAQVYQRLWGMRPEDPEVPQALAQCLRHTDRYQDLVGVLERLAKVTRDPASRTATLRELAHLWEFKLDNPWEAKESWERILALVPSDPEATSGLLRLQDDMHVPTAPEVRRAYRPSGAPPPPPPSVPPPSGAPRSVPPPIPPAARRK